MTSGADIADARDPVLIDIRGRSAAIAARGARLAGLVARLADLLVRPDRYRAIRRAVARPVFAGVRLRQPQLAWKYLNRSHLAIGLTSAQRAAVMIHHYEFLATAMPARPLGAILDRGTCLWRCETAAGCHRIDLVFSHPTDNEGELTLDYTLDGATVSVCSFSFAPGSLVGARDTTVIAVTRIQGMRDDLDRHKTAMRALDGVSPAMIFLDILTGLAARFGITTIAGVAADAQPARGTGDAGANVAVYDRFFASVGGIRATPIFYRIALPRPEKPIGEVKSGNRARTRAQRDLRARIERSAYAAFDGANSLASSVS